MNLFVSMASPISPSEAIEDDFEDNFEDDFAVSEYGGTQVSAFSSVTSSVYAHCYERGRFVISLLTIHLLTGTMQKAAS